MIGCPNCGNKLVFDVLSQNMKCKYCGTSYLVSEASKWSKDATEMTDDQPQEGMEVTTFLCSQCGGEICADDDEAVTWCSYCGSPATLTSRITRIRRPDYVVPLRKTKMECEQAYKKEAFKQIYAPRDLIRRGEADGFRGIYMPYWTYDISRNGYFDFKGEVTEPYSDEKELHIKYQIKGRLTSSYSGLSHDASQSFDDYVSERIAPYYLENKKQFNICYLNGFYANAADQDDEVYRNRVVNQEKELVFYDADSKFRSYGLKESSVLADLSVLGYGAGANTGSWREYDEEMETKPVESTYEWQQTHSNRAFKMKSKLAMFPMWFMSYRWGDRVSYATMNADSGKMYAEFPASPRRFLAISALTAIPLFFLLYFFYTLKPSYVLFLALMAAIGASGMFRREALEIFQRQYHIVTSDVVKKKDGKKSKIVFRVLLILALMVIPSIQLWWDIEMPFEFRYVYIATAIFASVLFIVRFFKMRSTYSGIVDVHLNGVNLWFMLIALAATAIFFLDPASDTIYYALSCGVVAVVCLTVTELIRSYNILSSTRPKQFNRSGGDDDNA